MRAIWCWILSALLVLAATVPKATAATPFGLAYTLTLAEEDHPTVELQVTGARASTTSFTFGVPGSSMGAVRDVKAVFTNVTVTAANGKPLTWHWQGDRSVVVENGAVPDFTIRYGVDALRIGRDSGMKFVIFRKLTSSFTADLVFLLPDLSPDRITVGFVLPEGIRMFSNLPEVNGRFEGTTDLWGNLLDDFAKAYFSGGRPLFDVTHKTEWGDTYHYVWFDRDMATQAWLPSYGDTPWEEAQAYMAKTEQLARYLREKIGPLPPRSVLFTNTKQAGAHPPAVKSSVDFYHYMQIWPRGAESDIAHHLVHAYSFFPLDSKLAFSDRDPLGQMLGEGLAMYFEMTAPATVLGEEYLPGKLFETLAVDRRGLPFGIAQNQFEVTYNRPALKLYLLDQYLRQTTGGKADLTAFTRALWDQVKANPHPQMITPEQIRAAFMAVAGTADATALDQIAAQTDFPVAPFVALLPEFRTYLDWMAEHYFASNRLLFLAFLDVVAAQGNEWPHSATNPHEVTRYRDQVLPAFRQVLADKSGPLTRADVLAMLKQADGQDHAGFFEFWSDFGIDLDPNSLLPLEGWSLSGPDEQYYLPLSWQSGGVLQTEHYLSGLPQSAAAIMDQPQPANEVMVQVMLASYTGFPPLAEAEQALGGANVTLKKSWERQFGDFYTSGAFFLVTTTDPDRQRFPFELKLPAFGSHPTFSLMNDGDRVDLYWLHALDPIPFTVALDGRNLVMPTTALVGATYLVHGQGGEMRAAAGQSVGVTGSGPVQVDLLDGEGFLRGRQVVVPPTAAVRVILNGHPLAFDVPPARVAGRLLVPLRPIAEALGAQVSWDQATQTVTMRRGESTIRLTIGSKTAFADAGPVDLDAAPEVRDGRTIVPLRFIAESLGLKVEWDDPSQTATLISQ